MDPIKLLEDDHTKVKGLMADCEKLGDGQSGADDTVRRRRELFEQIHREMVVHEVIEEEIFYPALRQHPKAKDEVLEGIQEHHVVDALMSELIKMPVHDEAWPAKFTVMRENIEHHIGEEEETMFPTAKRVFEQDELQRLGDRMVARKREAMSAHTLPEPPSTTA